MKKAFVVTSIINPDNQYPLTYSPVRTFFTPKVREMQTVASINCLDHVSDDKTVIYLLELSDNAEDYRPVFNFQSNLKFINLKHIAPETQAKAKTDPNKSRGELLAMWEFFKIYEEEMKQYDYFFKLSGRYLIDSSFDTTLFNKYNTDKIFFKKPNVFEWEYGWPYTFIDNRSEQKDNTLRFYQTVIFGWGSQRHKAMTDMFITMATILGIKEYNMLDVECLSYYFTRYYKDKVIETDWVQTGWQGNNGSFVRY